MFFAALLLSAVSMSCSKDPEETDKPNKPDDHNIIEWGDSTLSGDATMGEMKFNVENGISVRRGLTRGYNATDGQSYTFDANELITLAVSSTLRASEDIKDYKVTNTSTGALAYNGTPSTNGFFWKSKDETVSLRAWSYGNTTKTTGDPDNATYTLPADQSSNYGELLYAPAADFDYATYSSDIPLQLYHQLARVVINIEYDSGSSLTNVRIGDGSATIPRTATFTKPTLGNTTGTWTDFGSETDQITPKTETANTCYSAVLIPTTYAAGTKLFVITIGSETFAYKLDADLEMEAGKQYNYTVVVKNKSMEVTSEITPWGTDRNLNDVVAVQPIDLRKNPLWWMAEYNLNADGTFDTTGSTSQGYCFFWNSSLKTTLGIAASAGESYDGWVPMGKRIGLEKYHMPTRLEYTSIVGFTTANSLGIVTLFSTLPTANTVVTEDPCVFGYSNATRYSNGSNNTNNVGIAYKSYWSSYTANSYVRYAIRFLGSDYCSVWRYQYINRGTTTSQLEITAKLITPIAATATTALSNKMTEIMSNSFSWEPNANNGTIRRIMYSCGHNSNTEGRASGIVGNDRGHYWSATEVAGNSTKGWRFCWSTGNDADIPLAVQPYEKNYTFTIRLFKDE